MLDVKSEQKSMNLLDDYAEIYTKQSDAITDLSFKLDKAEQKIKELESKKSTEKKVAEKKAAIEATKASEASEAPAEETSNEAE